MSAAQRHNATVVGKGAKVVVLSHGFGTDQRVWKHMVPALSERYRVLTYDLACAGSVGADVFDIRRHATLEGYVEDLHVVLNDVGIERCIYVGHSVSAMIGLIAAQRMPGRLERMFMIAPSPARSASDMPPRGHSSSPSSVRQTLAARAS